MEPIQVEFTFTPETFGNAQMHIMLRLVKKGWTKWGALLLALGWLVKSVLEDGLPGLLTGALPILLFVGIWWLMFRWLSRRNFSKYPNLQYPIRYTFQEAEVELNTQNSSAALPWDAYQNAEEARDFFLLFQNSLLASPILKSGFQNEMDQERFRQLLRSKNLLQ